MLVLKTALTSSFGKVSSLLLDLARNFLFIKVLSVETFGILSLGNNLVQSNKYLDLGFSNKFLIDSYDGRFVDSEAKQIFFAIVIFEAFLLTICGLVCFSIMPFFDTPSEIDDMSLSVRISLPAIVLLAFFSARMYKLALIWRRHKKKFVNVARIELLFSVSMLACSFLIFVLDFVTFASSYFLIQAILFLACSVTVFKVFPGTKKNFLWMLVNWKPSLLLTSATLIYGLSFYFDRFILLSYFGLTEVGNYAFLLFMLNFGTSVITYGLQPVRAHIAKSVAVANSVARQDVMTTICKMAGLYTAIIGILLINMATPTVSAGLNEFFGKYAAAITDVGSVFKIFLTLPILYLLGYLIVAEPYSNTKIFALSQFSGIFCIAVSFFFRDPEGSIYALLLNGIYLGNLLKICIYLSIIVGQEKWGYQSLYQVLFLTPLLMVPIL